MKKIYRDDDMTNSEYFILCGIATAENEERVATCPFRSPAPCSPLIELDCEMERQLDLQRNERDKARLMSFEQMPLTAGEIQDREDHRRATYDVRDVAIQELNSTDAQTRRRAKQVLLSLAA